MDRMTDSGSVGWAFESPRDHNRRGGTRATIFFIYLREQGRRERSAGTFKLIKNPNLIL
jgi:hypothetical protein